MDQVTRLPPLAAVSGWMTASIVAASVVLALLAVALMFARARGAGEEAGGQRPVYIDPVLIVSAAGVIVLALAAWLTR
ncbi:MAG TPA: hypothetical protein VMM78_03465 [Thermomicrobiales bacterium]|nr:hypothetical protein [Thermomicrobiales bacterium]